MGPQKQDPRGDRSLVSLNWERGMTATLQSWTEPWGHCSSPYTRPQEGTGCARLGCGFNLGRFQPGGGEETVWGSEGMRNKIEPWC